MPKAAENRANVTLSLPLELAAKLERLVEANQTTKNAFIVGVLLAMKDEQLSAAYKHAEKYEMVTPKVRMDPEQKEMLNQLAKVDPAKLKALLAQVS